MTNGTGHFRQGNNELILVVDDQEEMRQLVCYNLEVHGYQAETAATGLEAVDKAERRRPDLILVDLILPEINGFGLCERLRRSATTAGVPIIVVSGWESSLSRDLSLRAGANDFVAKPFSMTDLLNRIRILLAGASTA